MSRCCICDYCETAPSVSRDLGQAERRKRVKWNEIEKKFFCTECTTFIADSIKEYREDAKVVLTENQILDEDKDGLEFEDSPRTLALSDV